MSNQLSHLELVQGQGAEPYEGFNPIAPRSHRLMMDFEQPEQIRVFGWAFWRTNDRDPKGQTGPVKKRRSIWAHDVRGWLTVKHMAEDLGMDIHNARNAIKRAEENGYVRRNEKGHILPRGDAPDGRRIKEEVEAGKEKANGICTDTLPDDIYLFFQQLEKSECDRCTAEYLKLREYRKRLEADAIALARDAGDELEQKYFESIGFQRTPRQGRRKNDRSDCAVQLSLLQPPPVSVQIPANGANGHSVQVASGHLYGSENASVQSPASLLGFSEYPEFLRVSEDVALDSASEAPASPPPAPLTSKAPKVTQAKPAKTGEPGPVSGWVEEQLEHRVDSKLRAQFDDLPERFRVPARSVIRFLRQKLDDKKAANYTIVSPGALYEFTLTDFPGWMRQNRRQITTDFDIERAEQAARAAPSEGTEPDAEAFDVEAFNRELRELSAKKGMS